MSNHPPSFLARWILNPHPDLTEVGERLTAQLLLALGLTFGSATFVGVMFSLPADGFWIAFPLIVAAVTALLGAAFSRRRHYTPGAYLLVGGLTAAMFLNIPLGDTPPDRSIFLFVPLITLLAITLLSLRGAMVILGVNIVGMLLIALGLLGDNEGVPGAAGMLITLIILALISLSFRNQVAARRLAERQQINDELSGLRDSLEMQVADRARSAEIAQHEAEVAKQALEQRLTLADQQTGLSALMRGDQTPEALSQAIIADLCAESGAFVGAFFTAVGNQFIFTGGYGCPISNQPPTAGGLLVETARRQTSLTITDLPAEAVALPTSWGEIKPRHLLLFPIVYQERTTAVIELGFLEPIPPAVHELLMAVGESVAVSLQTAQARRQVGHLLEETQAQAERLQSQEEELRAANEELEAQAESLRLSEARLREKQAELERTNAALQKRLTAEAADAAPGAAPSVE
jgi:hypothetical protein